MVKKKMKVYGVILMNYLDNGADPEMDQVRLFKTAAERNAFTDELNTANGADPASRLADTWTCFEAVI